MEGKMAPARKKASRRSGAKKKGARKATRKAARKPAKKAVGRKAGRKATRKAGAKKKGRKASAKKGARRTAKKKGARKAGRKKKSGRRGGGAAFMKPVTPSATLAAVIGDRPMPRTEVTKKVWEYIRKHGLQDKTNRRMINADDRLRAVFGGKRQVSMFEMTKLISNHLS
jgi:chromatin remodeling complex protein RSC6